MPDPNKLKESVRPDQEPSRFCIVIILDQIVAIKDGRVVRNKIV